MHCHYAVLSSSSSTVLRHPSRSCHSLLRTLSVHVYSLVINSYSLSRHVVDSFNRLFNRFPVMGYGLRRPRCFSTRTRYTGQYHTQYLVPALAASLSAPAMTLRSSGRSYSLRRCAASSVGSSGAS